MSRVKCCWEIFTSKSVVNRLSYCVWVFADSSSVSFCMMHTKLICFIKKNNILICCTCLLYYLLANYFCITEWRRYTLSSTRNKWVLSLLPWLSTHDTTHSCNSGSRYRSITCSMQRRQLLLDICCTCLSSAANQTYVSAVVDWWDGWMDGHPIVT